MDLGRIISGSRSARQRLEKEGSELGEEAREELKNQIAEWDKARDKLEEANLRLVVSIA